MANKQTRHVTTRRPSKRQRRLKVIIYVMVAAMLMSLFTAGLAAFL